MKGYKVTMRHVHKRAIVYVFGLCCVACTLLPQRPANEVALDVITAIEAQRTQEAASLFRTGATSRGDRDKMYPILFGAGTDRYLQGDFATASRLLRFTAAQYPDAVAVREALVYSLFLERSQRDQPDAAMIREIEQILRDRRRGQTPPPLWFDLVEAQVLIDQQRVPEAQRVFDRFAAGWNGQPTELAAYVEDLGRYLQTHE